MEISPEIYSQNLMKVRLEKARPSLYIALQHWLSDPVKNLNIDRVILAWCQMFGHLTLLQQVLTAAMSVIKTVHMGMTKTANLQNHLGLPSTSLQSFRPAPIMTWEATTQLGTYTTGIFLWNFMALNKGELKPMLMLAYNTINTI